MDPIQDGWSRYAYVYNNPISLRDDNGREAISDKLSDPQIESIKEFKSQISDLLTWLSSEDPSEKKTGFKAGLGKVLNRAKDVALEELQKKLPIKSKNKFTSIEFIQKLAELAKIEPEAEKEMVGLVSGYEQIGELNFYKAKDVKVGGIGPFAKKPLVSDQERGQFQDIIASINASVIYADLFLGLPGLFSKDNSFFTSPDITLPYRKALLVNLQPQKIKINSSSKTKSTPGEVKPKGKKSLKGAFGGDE